MPSINNRPPSYTAKTLPPSRTFTSTLEPGIQSRNQIRCRHEFPPHLFFLNRAAARFLHHCAHQRNSFPHLGCIPPRKRLILDLPMPSEQTESRLPRMEKSLTWKMGILE